MLAKHLIQTSAPSIVRGFRRHSFMTSAMAPPKDYDSIPAFHDKLLRSKRILAVCGAGLSSASGLPTFRGAGGLWRNHEATQLATPEAFRDDPGLVWLFYAHVSLLPEPNTHRSNKMLTFPPPCQRRHMALQVQPNAGHYALAALAKHNPDFLCLTQNVDSKHPPPPTPSPPTQTQQLTSTRQTSTSAPTTPPRNSASSTAPSSPSGAPATPPAPGPTPTTPPTRSARPSPPPRTTTTPPCSTPRRPWCASLPRSCRTVPSAGLVCSAPAWCGSARSSMRRCLMI